MMTEEPVMLSMDDIKTLAVTAAAGVIHGGEHMEDARQMFGLMPPHQKKQLWGYLQLNFPGIAAGLRPSTDTQEN